MKKYINKMKKYIDKINNKPIKLSKYEVTWIKLFKYHYKQKNGHLSSWTEIMKPIFIEIYGWNPDEDNNYRNYLRCMFHKLIDIHLKIKQDHSGTNLQIKEIISASFEKSISNDNKEPIERVINAIISQISNTKYLNKYGNPRYLLDVDIFN